MMRKDLALCIPPVSQVNYPFIAVPLLASTASASGISVVVLDANIEFLDYLIATNPRFRDLRDAKLLDDRFQSYNPDGIDYKFTLRWAQDNADSALVIGFSITSPSALQWSIAAAEAFRDCRCDACIVFGGAFCDEAVARRVLQHSLGVNLVSVGEGEGTLVEIVRRYQQGGPDACRGIPGTVYRALSGQIIVSPARDPVALRDIPFPDFSALPLDKYINHRVGIRALPVLGSRGCFARCTFCSERSRWRRHRIRSVESIVEEILLDVRKYGANVIRFNDSVLNGNVRRASTSRSSGASSGSTRG